MVYPYVQKCKGDGQDPTSKGFLEVYKKELYTDSTFRHLFNLVSRFSQAIINFRMGVRRNNSELIRSAKFMSKELFFARNHPKYQSIIIHDELQYAMMPEVVKMAWDKHSSITKSGHDSLGQDFDYVLEESNREVKSYIAPGQMPTRKLWTTLCRNSEHLSNLSRKLRDLLQMAHDQHGGPRPVDVEDAITSFRARLRRSSFLVGNGDRLNSLTPGVKMHQDLVCLMEQGTINRMAKFSKDIHVLKEDNSDFKGKVHIIYTTEEEFQEKTKPEKLTKVELLEKLLPMVHRIQDTDERQQRTVELDLFSNKNITKSRVVEFFVAVTDHLTAQEEAADELEKRAYEDDEAL